MELKEFVSQSLLQIFEGVKQAQDQLKDTGGTIAPSNISSRPQHPSIIGYVHSAPIISVDIDVSVTTTDANNSKAGLGLFIAAFSGGVQAGSESSNNQFNRLRFSVPVVLPSSKIPVVEQ